MNPKQKAENLVNKYLKYTCVFHRIFGYEEDIDAAKQCALIAVNEIIGANPHSNPFNTNVHMTIDYWLLVKKEIEKL